MRTIKIKYNIEDLISRVPSLFPCIIFDEYGNSKIHNATDLKYGSYGEIVADINSENILYTKLNEEVPYKETFNTVGNKTYYTYSYRTLMNYYYKNENIKEEGENLPNKNSVKDYVDKAIGKYEVNMLLFDKEQDLVPNYFYISMSKYLYNYYDNIRHDNGCCTNNLYYRLGGDTMLDILKSQIEISNILSKKYYNDSLLHSNTSFNININLYSKSEDVGILTPYINEWENGNEYESDENIEEIKKGGEIITYDDRNYVCISKEKSKGKWNNINKELEFDESAFSIYPSDTNVRESKYDNENTFIGSHNRNSWNFIKDKEYNIEGYTDSKLKSLRRLIPYIDESEVQVKPSEDEDWLYYYRLGIINYDNSTDDNGNILHYGDDYEYDVKKEYIINLYSYGSGIIDIKRDNNKKELTFIYVTNAHLKAQPMEKYFPFTDEVGNKKYGFKNFEFDMDSVYGKNKGTIYTETYSYEENGEIFNLSDDEFNKYITSYKISNKKYRFYCFNKSLNTIKIADDNVRNYINKAYFSQKIENKKDYLFVPTFKKDSMMRMTFMPKIDKEVKILRGNNAAFERHIKLSEIKTMDDLLNYQNGGFFNVKKVN